MAETGEITGTIAAILSTKQFGFISVPKQSYVLQGGRSVEITGDLFFHHTAVKDADGFACLLPGQLVRFTVIQGERGLKAVGVERAE